MQNGPPAARQTGLDIFRPVVQINDVRAVAAAHFLHRLVNFRIGLHRAHFAGVNIAIEIFEEGKIPLDVFDGEVVGVGENRF